MQKEALLRALGLLRTWKTYAIIVLLTFCSVTHSRIKSSCIRRRVKRGKFKELLHRLFYNNVLFLDKFWKADLLIARFVSPQPAFLTFVNYHRF